MRAQINQFSWHDYAVDTLTLKLNPTTNNNYTLMLDAEHLLLQGQRISHMTLKSDGTIAQHNIIAKVQSPLYGDLEFNLASGWTNTMWQGQFRSFEVALKKLPLWRLSSGAPMQADKNQFDLPKLCLTSTTNNTQPLDVNELPHSNRVNELTGKVIQESNIAIPETSSICITSKWNSTSGFSANINAIAIPLQQARAWFKPEVNLAGVTDAQFSLQAPLNNTPSADLQIQTRNIQFIYQFQGGTTEVYPLKQSTLHVVLKNNQANANLLMDWGKYGSINADGKYKKWENPYWKMPIKHQNYS